MRTTIRMNDELLRRAKKLAAQEGRTLTSIIEEGVATVVNSRQNPQKAEDFRLPVSKKGGGVWPGIDINNSAQLYEIMDRDGPPRR